MMKRVFLIPLVFLTSAFALVAQESIETDEEILFGTEEEGIASIDEDVFSGDEEDLFGDGELVSEVENSKEDLSTVLLTSDTVEIGGKFRFEAISSWIYDDAADPFGAEPLVDSFDLDLGALVYLDARPFETFRVYGEADVSYPFDDQGGTREFYEVFHVSELFSDFQLGDVVFFRAGKQTINWGVGYFFSPADLLNVTEIDPEDPEAELEGPVAVKIQAPLGAHNLYLYTVFEEAARIEEVALASKAEFVVGDSEIGLGAFYRAGDPPAAMTTLTTSLLDFDILTEGIVRYDERLLPSATAGSSYSFSDDLDYFNVSVFVQYMYNGEGANNEQHYGAANASWTDMFDSDFTLGCFWIGNLADGSGMIAPSLSWSPIEELEIAVEASYAYGAAGDEYTPTPAGDTMTFSLSASFGTGEF
jgi:hypothetical protein